MNASTRRGPAPAADGRPSFSAVDHGDGGDDRITPQRIRRYAESLGLEDLATFLVEWEGLEATHHTYGLAVLCPRCQSDRRGQTRSGPAAYVDDLGLTWKCGVCKKSGTHNGYLGAVLANPDAVRRIADHLSGGAW